MTGRSERYDEGDLKQDCGADRPDLRSNRKLNSLPPDPTRHQHLTIAPLHGFNH